MVGPPRAGTTLLGYLLGGAQDALSISEPFLAHRVYSHWRLRWFFARLAKNGVPVRVAVPRGSDHDRLFEFLGELTAANGLTYLAIKETYRVGREWANADLLERIALGPHPVVTITRHPFDAAVSTLRFCRWWRGIPGRLIRCWVHDLPLFEDDAELMRFFAENWAAFVDWVNRHELYVVRYEDLVSEPRRMLSELCDHCGLPFHERMLDHQHRRTAFGGLGAPEVMNRPPKPVNTASVGRARHLSAEHREIIRPVCREAAERLGYSL